MAKLFNRAKMTTATTGSGTVTLGSASNGFQTFAAAGVSNGDVVQYVIEEGANFEIGVGTFSSSGNSLTRSPTESSNSNNAITLAGQATVSITATHADFSRLQHDGLDKVTVASTGASVTGNLAVSGTVDGRDVASDGSKLDGIEANAKNDQAITAGGGLTGGGTGDVTISHSDTSSQASVNGSGRTYIQDVTLDAYGHVTGLATASETVVNTDTNTNQLTTFVVEDGDGTEVTISHGKEWKFVEAGGININWTDESNGSDGDPFDLSFNVSTSITAGSGLTGGGALSSNRTISHSDTSAQASVDNSGGTVIQDVTLDGFGHVTGLTSYNLDGRYYTETEADSRFVNVTGDTMTGELQINARLDVGTGTQNDAEVRIYKADNNVSDHIQFYNGTTRVGEIGVQDNDWLRINQVTAKNIYTPRYIRADAGLFVDGTTKGINSSGNFIGGTITGASDANVSNWNTAYTTANAALPKAGGTMTGDLTIPSKIIHSGDTDTYFQFHGANLARMVLAGAEVQEWGANYTLFSDNDTVRLGSGSDFRMWFDGSHTYFRNYAHSGGNIYFQGEDTEGTNHALLYMDNGGSSPYLRLYQNGGERLRTLSGGVGVTGLTVGDVDANPHNAGGLQVSMSSDEKIVLSGSSNPYIRFQEGTTDKAYIRWQTDGFLAFNNQESGNFRFRSHSTTQAVNIKLEANDGDLYGSVYGTHNNEIGFLDQDGNWAYRHARDSLHEWRINNGVEMSLSTSTLDMKGNTITEVEDIGLRDRIYHDGDTDTYIQFHAADQFRVVTGGSERFEVNNNDITCNAHLQMIGHVLDMNNNDIYGVDQIFHEGDTNTYMQFHAADQWRVVVGGSERLEVKNSSPHVLVSGDLNSTSDERLKKNIKPIDNALTDICQLEGVTFDWKDTGTQGQGFIAQQVEPIIPDVVNTDEDTGMKSINYVGLIGHLVEAIKEQQTQIDDLKAEIQSMKS